MGYMICWCILFVCTFFCFVYVFTNIDVDNLTNTQRVSLMACFPKTWKHLIYEIDTRFLLETWMDIYISTINLNSDVFADVITDIWDKIPHEHRTKFIPEIQVSMI